MDEKLIALAEALDAARMTANSIEATAPQSGVYGQISAALQSTLVLIVGSAVADEAYESLVRDGNNVRDAIDYATRKAASDELAERENAELEEIETELIRKYSSAVYDVVPCHVSGQVWEMQTFAAGTTKRTPRADFRVRAFKTSYGISTSSV
jgi:hypothetical protein